jgi:ribosomal subunit interface protein
MEAPEAKVLANEKSERLFELFPRVEHVHVVLSVEKHRYEAEVDVRGKNHIHVEADESGTDIMAAMDVAFDRVEKQLRKLRDKVQEHRVRVDEDVIGA